MKILLLTDGVEPYRHGGMPRQAKYLSRYLPLAGAELMVVHCIPEGEDLIGKTDFQELIFPDNNGRVDSICIHFPKPKAYIGHYVNESKLYSKRIYEATREIWSDYDFIYAKGFTGYHFLKNRTKKMPPVFVQLHGLEMFQKTWDLKSKLANYLLQPISKYLLKNTDYVFSYGGFIEELTIKLGVKKENIFYQYGSIETNRLTDAPSPTKQPIKFVFIPRYERRKGIPEFHQAVNELLKTGEDFKVEVIGPIPENERIQNKKITYHGQINNENDYFTIVKSCDIVLLPSISEGFPLVTVEAMAKGLTAIANNVGAVSALVNNKNGWLIPPTTKALENSMREAINTPPEIIDQKKKIALEMVRSNYIWPIQCANIISQAQSVIVKNKILV